LGNRTTDTSGSENVISGAALTDIIATVPRNVTAAAAWTTDVGCNFRAKLDFSIKL
jgi:hypothetical protein